MQNPAKIFAAKFRMGVYNVARTNEESKMTDNAQIRWGMLIVADPVCAKRTVPQPGDSCRRRVVP